MKLLFWLLVGVAALMHVFWALTSGPVRDTSTALYIAYAFYACAGAVLTEAVWRFLEASINADR